MKALSVSMFIILISCVCAYGSDIAFYVGQWNTDGWYDASQFDDVEAIIEGTRGMFNEVVHFDDDQLDEFGAWAEANADDDEFDIIWLNGCMPSCLYPFPNLEPDGSLAELWLDGGNMFINLGDWFAYASYECGARCSENGSTGAANILDLSSGVITSDDSGPIFDATPSAKKYVPSLDDPCRTVRPVVLSQVQDPWEVALILASPGGEEDPAKAVRADPVVIHNKETGGYLAIVNQASISCCGNVGWLTDRAQVCVELIKNWVGEVLGLLSVEPAGKLTTTWGGVKHHH